MGNYRRHIPILVFSISLFCLSASIFASESTTPEPRIRWPKGAITLYVSSSFYTGGSAFKTDSDVIGALERSLKKWEDAADIRFDLLRSEQVAVSPSGAAGDGVSLITVAPVAENILVFTKDLARASAMTRLFFDRQGRITEADIVLNPAYQFSTDRTFGTYDLETIFTHEIGHLLGLDHSRIGSAIMVDGIPKNQLFEANNHPRSLSTQDIAGIRGLYGAGLSDPECCGMIQGRPSWGGQKPPDELLAWAQDKATGAIVQASGASKGGTFELGGLASGKYDVLIQAMNESGSGAVSLGNVAIELGDNKFVTKTVKLVPAAARLEAIGTDGQLSRRAVRMEAGRSYRLLVGGGGLDQKGLIFGATSPLISVKAGSQPIQSFEGGLPVVFLEVDVDSSVTRGEYSLFVEGPSGQRRYFVGALSVN